MEGYREEVTRGPNLMLTSSKPRMLEASIFVGEAISPNNIGLSALYQKPAQSDEVEDLPDDPEDPMSARQGLIQNPPGAYYQRQLETPKDSHVLSSAAAAQKELRSILGNKPQELGSSRPLKEAGTSTELRVDNWDLMSAQTSASIHDKETITDAEFEEIGFCPCLSTTYWSRFFRITNGDFLKRMLYSLFFFRPSLALEIKDNPDLYGPFWIYSTLILVLASSGNLSAYFKTEVDWE